MVTRGIIEGANTFEAALPGTVYWTLSLYVEPDNVAAALSLAPGGYIDPGVFRRTQLRHLPSFALSNAIDPLMNDIADRETQGVVQEFLIAAGSEDFDNLKDAQAAARAHEEILFNLPRSVEWATEGVRYCAEPPNLSDDRSARMRRFWFAHNNGALSYHMSFSHHYGSFDDAAGIKRDGYDPATFYFLSLLQKLAAPKEFTLHDDILKALRDDPAKQISVFDDTPLGIPPLDAITVGQKGNNRPERFWHFVKRRFEEDTRQLFPRLANEMNNRPCLADGFERALLDQVPFLEVPGLKVPKSRFMFMVHDERFFKRLMPIDPSQGSGVARKVMVQDRCYRPYQEKLDELTKAAGDGGLVGMDAGYWGWVVDQPQYDALIKATDDKPAMFRHRNDGAAFESVNMLAVAMRQGDVEQTMDEAGEVLATPKLLMIPAFEKGRADCFDYLFLAGFNQNIIDFMNQDTSEILDSIDPIYPDSKEQADERFFVRYANHRAMITYVPKSRSLETGNDYIGTCPYAFLIHVLALHNEFLARRHEQMSLLRIRRIEALIDEGKLYGNREDLALLDRREPLVSDDWLEAAEIAINRAKMADFRDYERFRYGNPFRYDTERDVFTKLEELRGVQRKTAALALAVQSLEDHADDLQRRSSAAADKREDQRAAWLNVLLGGMGVFGAGQMFFAMGEGHNYQTYSFVARLTGRSTILGSEIQEMTTGAMVVALILFTVPIAKILFDLAIALITRIGRLYFAIIARLKGLDRSL